MDNSDNLPSDLDADAYQTIGAMTHGAKESVSEQKGAEALASATNANKGKFIGSGKEEKTVKRKVRQYPATDSSQLKKEEEGFTSGDDVKSRSNAETATRGDEHSPYSDTEVIDMSHTYKAPTNDY